MLAEHVDTHWHDVAAASELADGELRRVEVAGQPVCLGRRGDDIFAVDDTCPHAGGSLSEGLLDGKWLLCPLHAYAFDPRTGACPDDPRCAVDAYPTRIVGQRLQLRLGY